MARGAASRKRRRHCGKDAPSSAGLWNYRENPEFGDCLQPGDATALTGGSSSGAVASVLEDRRLRRSEPTPEARCACRPLSAVWRGIGRRMGGAIGVEARTWLNLSTRWGGFFGTSKMLP